MTSIYQDIRGALQTQAMTASGFPAITEVAAEGVLFTPVVGTTWACMTLMPSQDRAFSVSGGTTQHMGLFQVDIHTPSDNGTAAAEIAADAVRAVFAVGSRIPFNNETVIVDYAERKQAMVDPNWIFCPVTVRWRCFSNRN